MSPLDLCQPFVNDYQAVFGKLPSAMEPKAEQQRWIQLFNHLINERDQLRAELLEVKQDRDACLRAVKALLPEREYSFTKEELLSQGCTQPSLDDLIAELKNELRN